MAWEAEDAELVRAHARSISRPRRNSKPTALAGPTAAGPLSRNSRTGAPKRTPHARPNSPRPGPKLPACASSGSTSVPSTAKGWSDRARRWRRNARRSRPSGSRLKPSGCRSRRCGARSATNRRDGGAGPGTRPSAGTVRRGPRHFREGAHHLRGRGAAENERLTAWATSLTSRGDEMARREGLLRAARDEFDLERDAFRTTSPGSRAARSRRTRPSADRDPHARSGSAARTTEARRRRMGTNGTARGRRAGACGPRPSAWTGRRPKSRPSPRRWPSAAPRSRASRRWWRCSARSSTAAARTSSARPGNWPPLACARTRPRPNCGSGSRRPRSSGPRSARRPRRHGVGRAVGQGAALPRPAPPGLRHHRRRRHGARRAGLCDGGGRRCRGGHRACQRGRRPRGRAARRRPAHPGGDPRRVLPRRRGRRVQNPPLPPTRRHAAATPPGRKTNRHDQRLLRPAPSRPRRLAPGSPKTGRLPPGGGQQRPERAGTEGAGPPDRRPERPGRNARRAGLRRLRRHLRRRRGRPGRAGRYADVLVKADHYSLEQVVGHRAVLDRGGRVVDGVDRGPLLDERADREDPQVARPQASAA